MQSIQNSPLEIKPEELFWRGAILAAQNLTVWTVALRCNYIFLSFENLVCINIALVRALRIWGAQRMYWHTLPNQDLCHILVKMSNFWKIFFAFSIVKGLSDYVVKILALKFEPKKSYDRKTKFSLCRNALIDPDLAKHKSKQKYVSTYGELLKQRPREGR